MGAAVLLMAHTEGDVVLQAVVLASLVGILALTLLALLVASQLHHLLGLTGMQVVRRIFGVLLTALATQFIFDGIVQSHVFPSGIPG